MLMITTTNNDNNGMGPHNTGNDNNYINNTRDNSA